MHETTGRNLAVCSFASDDPRRTRLPLAFLLVNGAEGVGTAQGLEMRTTDVVYFCLAGDINSSRAVPATELPWHGEIRSCVAVTRVNGTSNHFNFELYGSKAWRVTIHREAGHRAVGAEYVF
ncbi:hypothetical protein DPEC_G00356830 [Dallia pectoralis]|uniref:Uncharacterized protein n=1 Tax=Dallia pectoralis TaxID=75939 RepID=A0ACC2EZY9_DALPE|nr:hypothetical protein DPEC_G00356830 [Dallia pectoralis]